MNAINHPVVEIMVSMLMLWHKYERAVYKNVQENKAKIKLHQY